MLIPGKYAFHLLRIVLLFIFLQLWVHIECLTNNMLTGAGIFFWVLAYACSGLLFGDMLSSFVSLSLLFSLPLLPVFVIFYYNLNFIRTISPYFISFLYLCCVCSSKGSFPWELWISVSLSILKIYKAHENSTAIHAPFSC